jgi:FAD/FMN-containing dehydrogenase
MNRRQLLQYAATIPFLSGALQGSSTPTAAQPAAAAALRRVRPADPSWPSAQAWQQLSRDVQGRLFQVTSPLAPCRQHQDDASCNEILKQLKNPYFIGDEPGLTQTLGWLDAWRSEPSAYAVGALTTEDAVTAVNFAREKRLRLVIKGGGHSYQGTSSAPDSLLIWTRAMKDMVLHDAFVGQGCAGQQPPQPAVSIGAGATWGAVYDLVTTRAGRYVQGGGCLSVGVAGLIQSGGFGSFSKNYGLAAAGLLEAEIVTADGAARIANACTNADLFWAIKGGGGGSLGVVTRLTLRTRELSQFVGGAFIRIRASSDAAFRELIAKTLTFYRDSLFNPHWGEQIIIEHGNAIRFGMLFQGLSQREAEQTFKPFLDSIAAAPQSFSIDDPTLIAALPARNGWDYDFFQRRSTGSMLQDDRPGASPQNVFWAGDRDQTAQFIHAYRSAWLPASLLQDDRRAQLAEALFACSRNWQVSLHVNKGLAGAPAEEIEAARHCATNPAVLDAFALAIVGAESSPAIARLLGREPNLPLARERAAAVGKAMDELLKVAPNAGSYVAESDYFERDWQRAFWGNNYPRLAEVKKKYDPDGLFFVRHGVGSEEWSADGFIRVR